VVASALRQRILTALVLVPLAVLVVLYAPTPLVALCFALVVLLAAREWTVLAGVAAPAGRLAYAVLVAACLLLLSLDALRPGIPYLLAAIAVFWWVVAVYLFRLRAIERVPGLDPGLLLLGLPVLAGPWIAIVHLHSLSADGPLLVLFLLVIIWVADSMAFFVGRRWGRVKLAPVLSPGKTREGVYGALAGAAVCGLFLAWEKGLAPGSTMAVVALCALTAFISVVGDLLESLIKRRRGVKDSGTLLPGHGGVLDRIDSLTAAAPLFAVGLLWLEAQP
jgi:phosphatidate cytidylyltransferase